MGSPAHQPIDAGGERLGVQVDVGLGGGRTGERHVVEGRQQDAAVVEVQVQVVVEFRIVGRGRLATVDRRGSGDPDLIRSLREG